MFEGIIIGASWRTMVDLAAEMRNWREFVEGEDYSVDLKDEITGETVTVRYDDDWEAAYLSIKSDAPGELFDRVTGRVIRTLSMHAGVLKIRRFPYDPERLFTPVFKKN